MVKRLLTAKADVNAREDERTALLAAAEADHLQVVERLLMAKADVNAKEDERKILQVAAEGGHL